MRICGMPVVSSLQSDSTMGGNRHLPAPEDPGALVGGAVCGSRAWGPNQRGAREVSCENGLSWPTIAPRASSRGEAATPVAASIAR